MMRVNVTVNGFALIGPYAGTVFDGGDGTDILTVGGEVVFQGTLVNMEGINLLPASNADGVVFERALFATDASRVDFGDAPIISGVGDIAITVEAGEPLDLSTVTFDADADVVFHVQGTSGGDTAIGTSRRKRASPCS